MIKSFLEKYFGKKKQGQEAEIIAQNNNSLEQYGTIEVKATYLPWNNDKSFLNTYNLIKNNTLVDMLRCYELWELIKQSKKCAGGGGA